MTENRPSPLALAELLRGLAECWTELGRELMRTSGKASRSGGEGKVPLDLDVVDARRSIENLSTLYAHMLMDDDPEWMPPATVTARLNALAIRVGHFTLNDNAQIAYEFAEDVERVSREAWAIARPNGLARIPVGPCSEDQCEGVMQATIDRDNAADVSLRAVWDKTLRCTEDGNHMALAGDYATRITGLAEHEIAAHVATALADGG